jgi:hypothetical protein
LAALLSILSSLLVGVSLWPGARGFLLNGFTRGAVTGLGLVNLAMALRDAHARLVGGPEV